MKNLFLILFLAFCSTSAHGQLRIDTSMTPQAMVKEVLIGERMEVHNIRIRGRKGTYAAFTDEGAKPLIGEGIVFSTGNVFRVAGPNMSAKVSGRVGSQGDRELFNIAKYPTYDATGISFEFKPEFEMLVFNFVFGSEEYVEYVNTAFNDVFAFFLEGPGYKGRTNLAVIPNTQTPISVNTVNHIRNKDFYIDNNYFDRNGKAIQKRIPELDSVWLYTHEMDGLTKLIQIQARVIPGEIYKLKVGISDVSDGIYDSMVMLEGKSFTSLPANLEAREAILRAEASQFRRAFEPGILGKGKPKPGPQLLTGKQEAPVDTSISPPPISPQPGPPKDWKLLVTFDLDSYGIDARAEQQLESGLMHLREFPENALLVRGHTCNIGNKAYNKRLSRKRAEAVKAYLVKAGIPANKIEIKFFDFSQPAVENDTEDHRSQNRRVEVSWK